MSVQRHKLGTFRKKKTHTYVSTFISSANQPVFTTRLTKWENNLSVTERGRPSWSKLYLGKCPVFRTSYVSSDLVWQVECLVPEHETKKLFLKGSQLHSQFCLTLNTYSITHEPGSDRPRFPLGRNCTSESALCLELAMCHLTLYDKLNVWFLNMRPKSYF